MNINRRVHNRLFRLGILLACLAFAFAPSQSTAQSTQGTEFYLSFMPNYPDNPKTTVYVSTKRATTVTISNPNTSYRQTYNLNAGVIQPISVALANGYVYPGENEVVGNKGLIVESTDTISVYLGNQLDMSFDAANVLPLEALSGNYMAMCYPSTQYSSSILIVSTEDDTYVNITPSTLTKGNKPAGTPFRIYLPKKGQTYLLQSKGTTDGSDLSGTTISVEDCKKVAVFSGNQRCVVPSEASSDHLVEQMFPLGTLGREFVVIPTLMSDPALPNLKKQYDRLRILAVDDNTMISIKNDVGVTFDTTLNKGKVYEFDFNSASYINSTNPIIVCLFTSTMVYKSPNNKYGDPAMIWVNPIEQNLTDIIFTALPTTRVQKHYVNVVTKTADHTLTRLDGASIASKCVIMGANGDYTYARVEITNPNVPHQIENPNGFSAYVYGYGEFETYGYTAGSNAIDFQAAFYINGVTSEDFADALFVENDTLRFSYKYDNPSVIIDWELPDGTFLEKSDSGFYKVVVKEPGYHEVKLIIRNRYDNCAPPKVVTATTPIRPEALELSSNRVYYCLGDTAIQFPFSTEDLVWYPDMSAAVGTSTPPKTAGNYYVAREKNGIASERKQLMVVRNTPDLTLTIPNKTPVICEGQPITLNATTNGTVIEWKGGYANGASVTPSDTGTFYYPVTVKFTKNGLECTKTDSIAAKVKPLPELVLLADTSVCQGEPAGELVVSNQGTVTWSPLYQPSDVFNSVGTFTYTATANLDGCTVAEDIKITVKPRPSLTIIEREPSICLNESITLQAIILDGTLSWIDSLGAVIDGGSSAPVVTPTDTGIYVYRAVVSNECTLIGDSIKVTVKPLPVLEIVEDTTICLGEIAGELLKSYTGTVVWSSETFKNTALPAGVHTFTATATHDNGCTTTKTATVRVVQAPHMVIANSADSICFGQTVLFSSNSSNGASVMEWSSGYLLDTPSTEGLQVYPITVLSAEGCKQNRNVQVYVKPLPKLVVANDTALCQGSEYTPTVGDMVLNYTGELSSFALPKFNIAGRSVTNITTTLNGCKVSDSIVWTVKPLPSLTLIPDLEICEGEKISSYIVTDNGDHISWNIVPPTYPTVGAHTYIATSTLDGCEKIDSVEVTVNALPDLNIVTSSIAPVCEGDSVELKASSVAGSVSWSLNGVSLPSGNEIKVKPVVGTSYYVATATNAITNCTYKDSVEVTVNALPDLNIATPSIVTVCDGDSVELDATSLAGVVSWSLNGVSLPSGNKIKVKPAVGTSYYVATATNAVTGCIYKDSVRVTVNTLPDLNIETSSIAPVCDGDSVELKATSLAGVVGWSLNGVSIPSGNEVKVKPVVGTSYYVATATNAVTGCIYKDSVEVTVNALPDLNIATPGVVTICDGDSVELEATSLAGVLSWSLNGVSLSSGSKIKVKPAVGTSYYVATATNAITGCIYKDSVEVRVNMLPDLTLVTSSIVTVCDGDSVELEAASLAGVVNWSLSGVSIPLGSKIKVKPAVGTSYYVATATNAVTGCTFKDSVEVAVNALPDLSITTPSIAPICDGDSVELKATSLAGVVGWSLNGVSIPSGNEVKVKPAIGTSYYVATATNTITGCVYKDSVEVIAKPLPQYTLDVVAPICLGDMVTFLSSSSNGASIVWVDGGSATPTDTGIIYYKANITLNGCSVTDSVAVNVKALPELTLINDTTICEGESISSYLVSTNGYVYWGPTPEQTPSLGSHTYNATAVLNGCNVTKSVTVNVSPLPELVIETNDTTICESESITLSASSSNGTVSWNVGVGAVVVETPMTVGLNKYIATSTHGNGCAITDTVLVSVTALPALTMMRDTMLCEGDSVELVVPFYEGTLTWKYGSSIISDTKVSPSIGNHKYVATVLKNGCSRTDTVNILMKVMPILEMINDTTLCEGSSLEYPAKNYTGTLTWNYTPESVPSVGWYNYIATADIAGCSVTENFRLRVNPLPILSVMNDTTICEGNSVNLEATTYQGDLTWTQNNVELTSTEVSPLVGTTKYIATALLRGCATVDSIDIEVRPLPSLSKMNDTTVCEGQSVQLLANSSDGTLTWDWSGGLLVTPSTGRHNYGMTVELNGCYLKDSVVLMVNPLPALELMNDTAICEGAFIQLYVKNSQGALTWSEGALELGSTGIVPSVGSHTYSVVALLNGCTSSDNVSVLVKPLPHISVMNDTSVCEGNSVQLLANSSDGIVSWDVIGGTMVTPEAGDYIYRATALLNGCTKIDSVELEVKPLPMLVLMNDTTICDGEFISLIVNSYEGAYAWDTSDYTNIALPVGVHTYTATAILNGCERDRTLSVSVNPIPALVLMSDTIVCPGAPVTLSALNYEGDLEWNVGNANITPEISDIYVATTTLNGCSKAATVRVDVDRALLPHISVMNDTSICEGNSVQLSANSLDGTISWDITGGSLVTPYTSTLFKAIAERPDGCKSVDFVMVQVVNKAWVTAMNNVAICEGEEVELEAEHSPDNVTWSVLNTTVYPTETTVYRVVAQNECFVAEDSVEVIVDPLPKKPNILNGVPSVKPNEVVSIEVETDTSILGFEWIAPSSWTTSLDNTHKFWATVTEDQGNVIVRARNRCGYGEDTSIFVHVIVKKVDVYPTHVKDILNIRPRDCGISKIEIMGLHGGMVYSENFDNTVEPININVGHYFPSVYIVRVRSNIDGGRTDVYKVFKYE